MTEQSSIFERLDPAIQKWIWRQQWSSLRGIQEQVGEVLLNDYERDALVCVATAGGKTEAAFFPLLTRLLSEPDEQGLVVAICPLKALINDQAKRLKDILRDTNIPVYRWHGDISASEKQKFRKEPKGILLITPESLEANFCISGHEMRQLFGNTRAVVVDEWHAFLGTERGRQLQSLMARLELAVGRRLPRVGLSATIGDLQLAADALRPGNGNHVAICEDSSHRHGLQILLVGIEQVPMQLNPSLDPTGEEKQSDAPDPVAKWIFKLRGDSHLVFANSKNRVESLTDALSRMSERLGVPNEYFPHHGNLDRTMRHSLEDRLKQGDKPTTAVCTSTLELGIDIGKVSSVAQVGCPPSVAALRQRLGRSGRRGEDSVLRLFVTEDEITPQSEPSDQLRLQLVQTIAMVELLLEKWYESPDQSRLHLSTLIQQVLSVIAERGGSSAANLYQILCEKGPFQNTSTGVFGQFLRNLGDEDLIRQESTGILLLGEKGERLVNHYDFYSAFMSDEEYEVRTVTKRLGTLPIIQVVKINDYLLFSGRRWQVTSVDDQQKRIIVKPAPAGKAPLFGGAGALVGAEVRQRMLTLYQSDHQPRYLSSGAQALLEQARESFDRLNLADRAFVPWGDKVMVFPWHSDAALRTFVWAAEALDIEDIEVGCGYACWEFGGKNSTSQGAEKQVRNVMEHVRAASLNPVQVIAKAPAKRFDKHDGFLNDEIAALNAAAAHVRIDEMREALDHALG
nr:DEAD/DEAH box helicase [Oceanococcus sp. HetDA_MAG_MS8]